jgi:hypothetical protein
MKFLLCCLLAATFAAAAEPTRDKGLSIHALPDRVAKIQGGKGGFTVTDPDTGRAGKTYPDVAALWKHFEKLPATVQQNGLWMVITNPVSYSEVEVAEQTALIERCRKSGVPIHTCRAADLPNGWKRAK